MSIDLSLAEGRRIVGDFAIYPNSLLFQAGDYPDKKLTMSAGDVAAAAASFLPVDFNVEHAKHGAHQALSGAFGGILTAFVDPADPSILRGEVALPLWLDERLEKKSPSLEFTVADKKICGAALTYTPRVSEAALMSAVAEFTENVQPVLDPKADAPEWAKAIFAKIHQVEPGAQPTPIVKEHLTMSDTKTPWYAKLIPAFGTAGVTEDDVHAAFSGMPTSASTGMTDTEKAEFATLKADNDRLKAEQITRDAQAFASGEVAARRVLPAEVPALITMFCQARRDDQSAPTTITFSVGVGEAAQETTGSRTDALKALYAARPAHTLTAEIMQDGQDGQQLAALFAQRETPKSGADKPLTPERRALLMNMTPLGVATLAAEKNGTH